MGLHPRGREYFLRNVVYHKVSAFELSVWRQWCRAMKTVPRRAQDNVDVVIMLAGAYLLKDWAEKANDEFHRKKPGDFADDV